MGRDRRYKFPISVIKINNKYIWTYRKAIADIRYSHRFYAEFAKEAMQSQSLGGTDVLNIKWAAEENNEKVSKQKEKDQKTRFIGAVQNKKKIDEKRLEKSKETEEVEKKRLEKLKKKQSKFYQRKVAGGNLYNPAFYQEYKPSNKLTEKDQQELQKERSIITENCAKLNEVLQRISYNYQEN